MSFEEEMNSAGEQPCSYADISGSIKQDEFCFINYGYMVCLLHFYANVGSAAILEMLSPERICSTRKFVRERRHNTLDSICIDMFPS